MRVYIESNFVLELVLEQEQHAACEDFVLGAERQEVELVLPAFSLFEPFTTLYRRQRDRNDLHERLQKELNLIARTKAFAQEASATTLPALLVRSAQDASTRFEAVQDRLLRAARMLPLNEQVFAAARAARATYALEPPDAIVLASVLTDLDAKRATSCFLNRNTKDFADPTLVGDLEARDCRMIGSFEHGLAFVKAQLAKSQPGAE